MRDAYTQSGVDYGQLDTLKRFAQLTARTTEQNLPAGMRVVEASRGESAFVIDLGPFYLATVPEGLGTKNLVADTMSLSGKNTYYHDIGKCTVAANVNDLITVGARPLLVNAHWGLGSDQFLKQNPQKGQELAEGWADACNESGAVYAAGETPILNGIIYPKTMELSGSAVGIIDPKERLVLGQKLIDGDHIILIGSSGVHANGYTLLRKIEKKLPLGYNTPLRNGRTFGETVLTPTYIYVKLQQALFEAGVDIHYMVNITGHGWAKLMRADYDFTYRIHTVPQPQEEFDFIKRAGGMSDHEMYNTFNMGAGFAFMVHPQDADIVVKQAHVLGFQAWNAGVVEEGPKQVIIEPKNIIYPAETLNIR